MNKLPANIFSKPLPLRFILFSILLSAIVFFIENINHRFWLNDFRVYYYAAEALLKGKQVYGIPFALGSGYYKYSPFALFFFMPYTVLPYYAASVVHFIVISISLVIAILIIRKIVTDYLLPVKISNENIFLSLIEICVLLHIVRELKMGNINIILVLILSVSLLCLLSNKQGMSGFLLGIAIMFKPYLAILILPLLFHKKFKALFFNFITICAAIVTPTLILGVSKNIELHRQCFRAMQDHSITFYSNHTIHSLIKNHFYAGLPSSFNFLIIAVALVAYILFSLWYRRYKAAFNEELSEEKQLIFEYFTLLSIIPTLLITDTEQFLYSLPLIFIVMSYLWVSGRNYLVTILFIVTILLYGSNSSDLLGTDLSSFMEGNGMLGISNLFIIGLATYIYFKSLPERKPLLNQS